jgi:flagellar FliL protein
MANGNGNTGTMNRVDAAKAAAAEKGSASASAEVAAAPEPAKSKVKEYLPLLANVVLMPVLAYAMTSFVLVPKLAKKSGGETAHAAAPAEGSKHESSSAKTDEAEKDPVTGKVKISVPLSKKTLVNVSGTMGTRYLLAEFVLVGTNPNLKSAVEKADAELRDAAAGTLATKTINDLEKPGIRNLIRSELMTVFNSILGKGMISEIYLTEFAIQ